MARYCLGKRIKKDSIILGLMISILLPIILFFFYLLFRFPESSIFDTLKNIFYQKYFSKMLSVCIYPNGIVFFYYIQTNKIKTMKGMLIGTIFMVLVMLVLYVTL